MVWLGKSVSTHSWTEGLSSPEPLASYGETLVKGRFEDSRWKAATEKTVFWGGDSLLSTDSGIQSGPFLFLIPR